MPKLFHNMAMSYNACIQALTEMGQETHPTGSDGQLWCNATWDSVLCWPAAPAGTTSTLPCPPLKGLDPNETVSRRCLPDGRWMGKTVDDVRPWTDYTQCMTITQTDIEKAAEISRGVRLLEYVGLAVSAIALVIAISILVLSRHRLTFRIHIHAQLFVAILLTTVLRLALFVDLRYTEKLGTLQTSDAGYTINTTKGVCEVFFVLLEYGRSATFAWILIEVCYLHSTVIMDMFKEAPKLWKYLIFGWGLPLIHIAIWLVVALARRGYERCLGVYYMHTEFWIVKAVRSMQTIATIAILIHIVRIRWCKAPEGGQPAANSAQLKIGLIKAVIVVMLLGLPNIFRRIPYMPTRHNMIQFAVFTYAVTFFYVFQGFLIAAIYCFTNREVMNVIKARFGRSETRHAA